MQTWTALAPVGEHNFHHAVVTIGNFDGLHLGHQALLAAARRASAPRVVMTFSPHPVQVLYPERGLRRLLPREDLADQLPRFGVDLLVELPFTREFASLSAGEFLESHVATFTPRRLVAGYDFGFGRSREGTLAELKRWSEQKGAELEVVPPLDLDGEVISSRRLRRLIEEGDVATAARLLGRPFYLRGRVGRGAGRGNTIGFPTLNQTVINETLPAPGVYASRARLVGGEEAFASVTNIGVNPTFGGTTEVKIETHVIDADVAWRERMVDVDLLARVRGERKFAGVDELKAQIARDVAFAREFES